MSYWGGAWNSLKFLTGSTSADILSSISYRYLKKNDGNLIYKNNRAYNSVLVHVARQTAMQAIEGEVNKLFPRYQKYLSDKQREAVKNRTLSHQERIKLIQNGEIEEKGYGKVSTDDNFTYIAQNKYGEPVPEALMLYYKTDKEITVLTKTTKHTNAHSSSTQYESGKTKTICFVDLAPNVSIQSSKNLVLTTVQGRDYTRKELVSGGDLTFSVSGEIAGDEMDVYPESEVQKFIQIAQYGGVIKVNHLLFKQFNIEQVIIKDYQFSAPECKNIQPYSFTCVAVEPDEDVIVTSDTISVLNREIEKSPQDKWYKMILEKALSNVASNAAGAVSSITNAGLDALVPNI